MKTTVWDSGPHMCSVRCIRSHSLWCWERSSANLHHPTQESSLPQASPLGSIARCSVHKCNETVMFPACQQPEGCAILEVHGPCRIVATTLEAPGTTVSCKLDFQCHVSTGSDASLRKIAVLQVDGGCARLARTFTRDIRELQQLQRQRRSGQRWHTSVITFSGGWHC